MYTMPKPIKDMITSEFCEIFALELHLQFGVGLTHFSYSELNAIESTIGWHNALIKACQKTNSPELLKYYDALEWYDSDMFDGLLMNIMVEHKLFMPMNETEEIMRQTGLELSDISFCPQCQNYFQKRDMSSVSVELIPFDDDDDEPFTVQVCHNCANDGHAKPLTIDIHRSVREVLNRTANEYFICEKCGIAHLNNRRGKQYCLYCENNL